MTEATALDPALLPALCRLLDGSSAEGLNTLDRVCERFLTSSVVTDTTAVLLAAASASGASSAAQAAAASSCSRSCNKRQVRALLEVLADRAAAAAPAGAVRSSAPSFRLKEGFRKWLSVAPQAAAAVYAAQQPILVSHRVNRVVPLEAEGGGGGGGGGSGGDRGGGGGGGGGGAEAAAAAAAAAAASPEEKPQGGSMQVEQAGGGALSLAQLQAQRR